MIETRSLGRFLRFTPSENAERRPHYTASMSAVLKQSLESGARLRWSNRFAMLGEAFFTALGWEVAARMKEIAPDTLAIIHTAHGSMDTAIQALRMRVFDFLPKPCSLFDLDSLLLRVAEHRTLMNKTIALEKSLNLGVASHVTLAQIQRDLAQQRQRTLHHCSCSTANVDARRAPRLAGWPSPRTTLRT